MVLFLQIGVKERCCNRPGSMDHRRRRKQKLNTGGHGHIPCAPRYGLVNWYGYPISTGPVEGTRNKSKTPQRKAFGFKDKEPFKLKIFAFHETRYALVGWPRFICQKQTGTPPQCIRRKGSACHRPRPPLPEGRPRQARNSGIPGADRCSCAARRRQCPHRRPGRTR